MVILVREKLMQFVRLEANRKLVRRNSCLGKEIIS